jgi:glycosyltransferase involved in cell wall biosynthesis
MTGGAARACSRLLDGLAVSGADATLIVREKTDNSSGAISAGTHFGGRMRALLDGLPLHLYPRRRLHNFSPAWVPGRGVASAVALRPDVVHLHWVVNGFVQIEALRWLRVPVVWTLHDSWPFTGGCHLPGECCRYENACGFCPVLGSAREHDLSRRVWMRKRRAWTNLDLTCVAPSRWLADRARASSLLAGRRIEVIPNGVDVSLYCPGDRQAARAVLGLPAERQLILFGANHALSDRNKGFDLLLKALKQLSPRERAGTELVLFGDDAHSPFPDCGMPVRNLGILREEAKIVQLYRAVDLFVAPSRQENLPNMILEAMACATPCAAFAVGGLPDLIRHGVDGYLAAPGDTADLGRGIAWMLEDPGRHAAMSAGVREKVMTEFALERVSARYLQLYRELLAADEEAPSESRC